MASVDFCQGAGHGLMRLLSTAPRRAVPRCAASRCDLLQMKNDESCCFGLRLQEVSEQEARANANKK